MRVLLIASTDDHLGGFRSLLELVELLKDKGIDVVVVNPFHNGLNEVLNKLDIENYSVGYHLNICRQDCGKIKFIIKYFIKYIRYKLYQLRGIYNLNRVVDFNRIDIIHQNNSVEDIGVYFSKKYNIPLIWHLREFGDLDFNFHYFHKNIGSYISNNSWKVIAISEAIKNAWVDKGINKDKIVTIMHGVNPEGIIPRKNRNKVIRIIFAGNIVPQKGQFDFIKAVANLEKKYREFLCIDFYGTCSEIYKEEIEQFLNINNLNNIIHLKGYTNNLKELLGEYDIGVVNSRCEAMGRVTIEYMMAGLCVLCSDRGANIELTENGKYGLLYQYDNLVSITNMLIYIIENFGETKKIGEMARKRALENYSILNNVDKFVDLYDKVIQEKIGC